MGKPTGPKIKNKTIDNVIISIEHNDGTVKKERFQIYGRGYCTTMSKANAVVVGATGYVGSAVTKALSEHGLSVKCASRDVQKANWLKDLGSDVEVVPLQLSAGDDTIHQLKEMMRGSDMVFFCAGFEEQSPSTIEFMVSNALAVIQAAKEEKVPAVVLTSSGGSTNPQGLRNITPKSETLHFSDPNDQIKRGRYSPAAKTLMEIKSLEAVGRNHKNVVVDEELAKASSTPRLTIINPNLILGPQLDPSPSIKGNSLPWMVRILRKETMVEFVPNDSMSIIDIRDLAELHVAAALNPKASGRYFGVNRSFSWKEILTEFSEAFPTYTPPPLQPGEDYEGKIPTQFDHSRKDSLGVTLRPLKDTLRDLVDFFKSKGMI